MEHAACRCKNPRRVGIGPTYFSQHLGASSTNRSMVMSPSDVSSSTDMVWVVSCRKQVFVANVRQRARDSSARDRVALLLSHHDVTLEPA